MTVLDSAFGRCRMCCVSQPSNTHERKIAVEKKTHNRIMKKKLIELWETRLRSSCRHKTFNPSHAILNRLNIYWMCAVYEWVSVCMSKDWATGNQFDDERYSLLAMVIVASERDRDATTFESSPRTSINGRDGPTHIWTTHRRHTTQLYVYTAYMANTIVHWYALTVKH